MIMDMDSVLKQMNDLFAACQIERIELFLEENIERAFAMGDGNAAIRLINEMMGYLRDTGKNDKALYYCDRALNLVKQMGIEGTLNHGITLLNVANAYRAAGKLRESMVQYQAAERIFEGKLPKDDMLYASFYNNLSLLYQEMGEFEKACACLEEALAVSGGSGFMDSP